MTILAPSVPSHHQVTLSTSGGTLVSPLYHPCITLVSPLYRPCITHVSHRITGILCLYVSVLQMYHAMYHHVSKCVIRGDTRRLNINNACVSRFCDTRDTPVIHVDTCITADTCITGVSCVSRVYQKCAMCITSLIHVP